MEIIMVNKTNISTEHICCAISDKKGENCVSAKKDWMSKRFDDGLMFKKLDVRGKVFIEYMPAEHVWMPIDAPNYLVINCFWVSGKYKGQGYANQLLDACVEDAKNMGKAGIVVLSSDKKRPFLSDPNYLKHKGFKIADQAAPYFELLYLPFTDEVLKPEIKDCAKKGQIEQQGMTIYFTNQCPFAEKYTFIAGEIAKAHDIPFNPVKIDSKEKAQNAPTPFTTYGFFFDGEYITNEIFSEKKLEKFLAERKDSKE